MRIPHDDVVGLMDEASDRLVMPRFGALQAGDIDEKRANDFVTIAAREAERFLAPRLEGLLPGSLALTYVATVDIYHHLAITAELQEVPVSQLPLAVLPYLYPSRYCPSDVLGNMVMGLFGAHTPGYSRVLAVQAWVRAHVTFKSNTSNSATSALDTLRDRVGVCRDFAHLMIALCRALNMPARFSTGTDFGADPALGPPDFHAYVEVYLSHRWYIFDPSGTAIPLGFMRIGTGRDAADVPIATIFGGVLSEPPVISVSADPGTQGQYMVPSPTVYGISTA